MPDCYASTGEGLLLIANGVDRMLRWDGYATNAEPAGLERPTAAVSAGGSGVGTLTGSYFAFVSYVRRDGFESALAPISGDFVLNNSGQVDYTGVPVSPDPRVVARKIWRNTDGQARTVYLDVTIDNNVDTTATSTKSDTSLQGGESFALLDSDNEDQTLNNSPPRDDKPFVAIHLGYGYAAGFVDYAEGSCEVTTGSAIVQGRGTRWKSNWAGRLLYVTGGDATYTILSVDETLQQITLTDSYTGSTNLFAGYAVRPTPGDCSLVAITLPGEYEAWPPLATLSVPDDEDPVTGLMPLFGFLYFIKRRSIYRFTAQKDPLKDGFVFLSVRRGCINHRCYAVVDDVAFCLDERGVHRFTGGQESQDISGKIQDVFHEGSASPINWNAAHFFHCAHTPSELTIRWYVCFRGDYLPSHALAYNYSLDRWEIEQKPRLIGASALGQAARSASSWGTSGEQLYLGSDAGSVFSLVQDKPDILLAPEAVAYKITAAGLATVSVDGPLTDDLVGCPVVLRKETLSFLQTRRIVAVDGQTLTVTPPWQILPAAKDALIIGGFPYQWRSQGFRYTGGETTGERAAEVFFTPNRGSFLDVEVFQDDLELLNSSISTLSAANFKVEQRKRRPGQRIDLSKREGFGRAVFSGLREANTDGPRILVLQLTGVGGNGADKINEVLVKGVTA